MNLARRAIGKVGLWVELVKRQDDAESARADGNDLGHQRAAAAGAAGKRRPHQRPAAGLCPREPADQSQGGEGAAADFAGGGGAEIGIDARAAGFRSFASWWPMPTRRRPRA